MARVLLGGHSVMDRSMVDAMELMMIVAHRARIALEESCASDEYVAHEVLLLRALGRAGDTMNGRELARALGWSPGRVSEVVKALHVKQQIWRTRRGVGLTLTGENEARSAASLIEEVAEKVFDGMTAEERETFARVLRGMDVASAALWRVRRNVDGS